MPPRDSKQPGKQARTDVPVTVAAPVPDFTPETMDPIPAEKPKVVPLIMVPDVAHYVEVSSVYFGYRFSY